MLKLSNLFKLVGKPPEVTIEKIKKDNGERFIQTPATGDTVRDIHWLVIDIRFGLENNLSSERDPTCGP